IVFSKGRQFAGTSPYDGSGGSNLTENRDCLVLSIEDNRDQDYFCALHDGERKVPLNLQPNPPGDALKTSAIETPAYKVQPFRWGHIGATAHWTYGPGQSGGHVNQEPGAIGRVNSQGGLQGFWQTY